MLFFVCIFHYFFFSETVKNLSWESKKIWNERLKFKVEDFHATPAFKILHNRAHTNTNIMSNEPIKRNKEASNQPDSEEGADLGAQNPPQTPKDVNPGGGKNPDTLFQPRPRGRISSDQVCIGPCEHGGFDLRPKVVEEEENARDPSKPGVFSSTGAKKISKLVPPPQASMPHAQKRTPSGEDDGREVGRDLNARIKRVKKNTQDLVDGGVVQLGQSYIFNMLGYEFLKDALSPELQHSQLGVPKEGQRDLNFYIEEVRKEAVKIVEDIVDTTANSDDFRDLPYDFLSDAINTSLAEPREP